MNEITTITTQGKYNAPDGSAVTFEYSYPVLSEDILSRLDSVYPGAGSLVQRQEKTDAGNTAREKVKAENGHSSRKPMSEEEKAEAKAKRNIEKEILAALRAKGLTLDDVKNL